MNKFKFLRAFFSPFKRPRFYWYIGKIAIGTPYFYPRRWVKNKERPGYLKAVNKWVGFDFVDMGWKTKWGDYRFEWRPVWSFVFFKWQIALQFIAPEEDQYWECWLYYIYDTDKSKSVEERIKECMKKYPCIWIRHEKGGKETTINYYTLILKKKYLKLIP